MDIIRVTKASGKVALALSLLVVGSMDIMLAPWQLLMAMTHMAHNSLAL